MILAIDPGTTRSGWVLFDGGKVLASDVAANERVVQLVTAAPSRGVQLLAIEKVEAMGMAVGAEVFETVHWAGRFAQAWPQPDAVLRVTRRAVKLHLCGSMKAKDPNIRQALIDALGEQGTKRAPGPTYGVSTHAWAALAVAVTAMHQLGQQVETQPAPLFREPRQQPKSDPFMECQA